MKKIYLILIFNFLTLASIQAYAAKDLAAELKQAQQDLSAGHFDIAYSQYLKFAQQGNSLAQFTTAMYHQLGWGNSAIDPIKACHWHEKAAEGAIPASSHFYAECLEKGIGRPSSPTEAAQWYEKAANLGHLMSLCSLADLYMTGTGVTKNPTKGLQLCQQAAEKGAVPARLKIALYYLNGDLSIRDLSRAYQWLEMAAVQSAHANYLLGTMHDKKNGTPAEKTKALYWYENAASLGYVPAYLATAKLYFQSFPELKEQQPTADNLAKAYMWLSASKQSSFSTAESEQVNTMLNHVNSIMPKTWLTNLDQQVKAHFKSYPVSK